MQGQHVANLTPMSQGWIN